MLKPLMDLLIQGVQSLLEVVLVIRVKEGSDNMYKAILFLLQICIFPPQKALIPLPMAVANPKLNIPAPTKQLITNAHLLPNYFKEPRKATASRQ
jgi:hypothetical protein